jgi:hypothetical protein
MFLPLLLCKQNYFQEHLKYNGEVVMTINDFCNNFEVSANVFGQRVPRGQRDGFLRQYSRLTRRQQLLFFQVAPQLY